MPAAKRYLPHYTVDDYARWEGDWELWDGLAVSMSPSPFGPHQAVAANLIFALKLAIQNSECDATVLTETDWIIREDTVVRPDVVVLCDGVPERHIETTPALVAEVLSDSTRQRDETFKRDLYNAEQVGIYLLLDPENEILEVYRRLPDGTWQNERVSERTEFSVCDNCKIQLDRASIFAR